jgi:hypothetical protein
LSGSSLATDHSESHRLARLAGWLYLLTFPTTGAWYGISASLLGGGVATLESLQAGRGMLELAILLGAIGHANHVLLIVVLHRLLRAFGDLLANLMLVLLAASVPLSFVAVARELDLLTLLDAGPVLAALGPEQVQVQITLLASSYTSLFNVQAIFWGLWLVPLGVLLLRSRYVPKPLALLVFFGAPFYVMSFVGPLFDPAYATSLAGRVLGTMTGIPELLGEVGTAVWLAIRGTRSATQPAARRAG